MKEGWYFKDPEQPDNDKREPRKFTKDQIRDYERRVSRSDSLLFHVEIIQSLNNKLKASRAKNKELNDKIKSLEDRLYKQQI